jgi:hypothetical protein
MIASYRGRVTTVSGVGTADSGTISVDAGDMLVVALIADSYQDLTHASITMTWPDSRGFTYWTEHAFWGNSYDGCYTQIAAYRCPTAGNPAIHVVTSGSAQGHRRPSFEIWTITGADPSNPAPWSDNRDAFGNPMSLTLHSVAGTTGDTIAIICGADGFSAGDPYVSGDGINPGNGYTQPSGGGEPGISGFSTAATWHTPDTNQSLVIDPPGSSMAVYAVSWMEFQAARTAPVVNAGADATIDAGGWLYRTATESGGGVSSRQWTIQSGPAGVGSVIGTAAALSWNATVVGNYVLRYSATNAFGTGTDDVGVTVQGLTPVVDAGLDRTVERTINIIRTAGEPSAGGTAITARQWRLMSGPAGSGAPVDLAAYGGDPKRTLLPNTVLGAHVIRYTATNSTGAGYDEATITVVALRPVVDAGPDEARGSGLFTRTAQEQAGDNAITSRQWKIQDGPTSVGTVIGTAAALSWTPPSLGRWTLRYTATSAAGASDPDDCVITVGVTGVPLNMGVTPAPKLAVSIAFAGDLTDTDGSSWAFTEVTEDVRIKDAVHLKHGRADEASVSQPATCTFTLDNRAGKYSLGGGSPYWPNIRQGTPVKIEIDLGSGFVTVFVGYADGFTPEYTINPLNIAASRGDSTVKVSASGVLRRLAQGQPPVISPLRRGYTYASNVIAYWPCEDDKNAAFLASAIPGHPPMDFSGRLHAGSNPNLPAMTPKLAESTIFDCSKPLPTVNDSEWYGDVPRYTATTDIDLWMLLAVPDAGSNDETVLIGLITTGDPAFWELRYKHSGMVSVRAWRNFATIVVDQDATNIGDINGRIGMLGLRVEKNGTGVDWEVGWLEVGSAGPVGNAGFLASSTVGRAKRVQTATDGGHVGVTMGHIILRSAPVDDAENLKFINAYISDQVGERLLRISTENLLPFTQIDGDVPVDTVTDQMGPQQTATVSEIMRQCETCDQGILWDGRDPGIVFTTKRYRESRAPALTLNAVAGEVGYPFQPVHDDANRRNRVTATRTTGASAIQEDVTGALGSAVVGRYDDSIEVNVEKDTSAQYYAGWLVHTGTVEGYRWPRLTLNLRANPDLMAGWLPIIPGDRIDVLNLSQVNASAPTEPISLAVEGFEQTITDSTWDVTINCSPYQAWAVAQACARTGDVLEFGGRADTSGSAVATLIAAGQTTLSVTTTAGPIWTTVADDYPFYLDVGDVRVRATACVGASSPQTFTIDPIRVTRPAGTPVKVWRPPVLGL